MQLRQFSVTAYRRAVQFTSLLLLNSSWGPDAKWLCNPVLTCHSCALAWFACPVGVFVHYSAYQIFPFFAIGTVMLLGVLFGRLLCGWVCPFGFLQDLLHKIPTPKFRLPQWTRHIKYGVLFLMVLLFPFLWGENTLASFCRVCPASALEVTIPNIITGGMSTLSTSSVVKLVLLCAVIALAIVSSRSFCRALCPIGAMLAPLNLITFWKLKLPTEGCTSCGRCTRACPQEGTPQKRIAAGIPPNRALDCIVCHECGAACPQNRRTNVDADEN